MKHRPANRPTNQSETEGDGMLKLVVGTNRMDTARGESWVTGSGAGARTLIEGDVVDEYRLGALPLALRESARPFGRGAVPAVPEAAR